MTKTIIAMAILLSFNGLAQTKRIAHKSHSGTEANYNPSDYTDNYGAIPHEMEEMERQKFEETKRSIQTTMVVLLPDDCVKVIRANGKTNILCDHPYFTGQYTFDEIKAFFDPGTKFVNFERKFFNHSVQPQNSTGKQPKQKGFWWLLIPAAGVVAVNRKERA